MKGKLDFSWEAYQTGIYTVETKDGCVVKDLHRLPSINKIVGVVHSDNETLPCIFESNGNIFEYTDCSTDLVLVKDMSEETPWYISLFITEDGNRIAYVHDSEREAKTFSEAYSHIWISAGIIKHETKDGKQD